MDTNQRIYVVRNGICYHIISILPPMRDASQRADLMKPIFKAGYLPELVTVGEALRDFDLNCDCHLTPVEREIKNAKEAEDKIGYLLDNWTPANAPDLPDEPKGEEPSEDQGQPGDTKADNEEENDDEKPSEDQAGKGDE